MCYTCCHKNKYHGGGIAENKKEMYKAEIKNNRKVIFFTSKVLFSSQFF